MKISVIVVDVGVIILLGVGMIPSSSITRHLLLVVVITFGWMFVDFD